MSFKVREVIPSFGTYRKRKLNEEKQRLVSELLPSLTIAENFNGYPKEIFSGKYQEIIFEIGFGDGGHIAEQAKTLPTQGFIGSEIYINGIAALLKKISDDKINNIRIFREDARILLANLADASLDKIFILFPDPWPKAKHHKRRLISQKTLELLHRKLKSGGLLRLATDWPEYAEWMIVHLMQFGKFEWQAITPFDWRQKPEDHIATKYQEKAMLQGREPYFFNFIKF